HDEQASDAAKFDPGDRQWVATEVSLIDTVVGDVKHIRGFDDSGDRVVRTWPMRPLVQKLGKGGRVVEIRDESRSTIVKAPQRPKMRTADTGSILQHCLEHRF